MAGSGSSERKYGEFYESPKNITTFNSNITDLFYNYFLKNHCKTYGKHIPKTIGAVPKVFLTIYIDKPQLTKVAVSAFHDIQRCANYHNLFDKGTGEISICPHKKAGYIAKWFVAFSPIIVPENELYDIESQLVSARNAGNSDLVKIFEGLYHTIYYINEMFILRTVFTTYMGLSSKALNHITADEMMNLVKMMSYRSGRLQGVDLAMIFHWMQETLRERSK